MSGGETMSNILIIDANQGIGYYLAESLLESGNRVAVLDIQTDHIAELQSKFGNNLLFTRVDAVDSHSVQEGVKKALTALAQLISQSITPASAHLPVSQTQIWRYIVR